MGAPASARWFSIRVRLLLTVLLALVPAVAIAGWTAQEERASRLASAQADERRVLAEVAYEHQRLIDNTRQLLFALSQLPLLEDNTTCSTLLTELASTHPTYANLGVARSDGSITCSAVPLQQPVNIKDRAYFIRAMSTGEFAVGDYQVGRVTGVPSLNAAQPLLDAAGEPSGVVYAALDLSSLGVTIAERWLPAGAVLTMLDGNGVVLSRHPDPKPWLGHDASASELFRNAQSGRESATLPGIDGVQRLYMFTALTAQNMSAGLWPQGLGGTMYLAVGIPTEVAFAAADAAFVRDLAILGAVGLAAATMAWWMGDVSIARPIRRLVEVSRRLSEGKLEARSGMRGRGEMGDLGRAFDDMAGSLATLVAREAAYEEIRRRDEELRVSMLRIEWLNRELASRNRELDDFAYVVSHDLKAPLRAVHHLTEWIEEDLAGELRGETPQNLRQLRENAARMDHMVDALLTYARAVRARGKPEEVDVRSLVADVIASLRVPEGFVVEIGPLPAVRTERVALRQVFQNLIGNAVEHHDRDRGTVRISAAEVEDGVEFTVEDDGPGIAPQFHAKAFQIFQTLGSRRKDSTGVGLATVKRLVERHGGCIRLESEGRGARFRFTWPKAPVAEVPA